MENRYECIHVEVELIVQGPDSSGAGRLIHHPFIVIGSLY